MPVKLHLLSLPTTGCPDQTPPCPSLLQALPRPLLCRPQRRQILIARTRDLRTTGLKHNSGSACALLHSPPLSWASDDKRLLRILASQTAHPFRQVGEGRCSQSFHMLRTVLGKQVANAKTTVQHQNSGGFPRRTPEMVPPPPVQVEDNSGCTATGLWFIQLSATLNHMGELQTLCVLP